MDEEERKSRRRRKHEQEEAAPEGAEARPAWAADYDGIEPDLDDVHTDLDFVRRLQLVVLKQMARTPAPSVAQQAHWARIREMAKTVGLTHDRAKLEAEVRRLRGLQAQVKGASSAVVIEDAATLSRPATARGRGGARGPRALPGPGPGPAEGEGP